MEKWEYLRLVVSIKDYDHGTIYAIYSNGVYEDGKKLSVNIHDHLNKLGRDGWELVQVYFGRNETYLFKRIVENDLA
jgi:hypothetical protein